MQALPQRRNTLQRRLVYEAVAGTDAHPTAEWVYERVRRQMPRVSLGTVYRNLQLLVAEGRLRSWTRGRTTRYDADLSAPRPLLLPRCGLLLDLERAPRAVRGGAAPARPRTRDRGARAGIRRNLPGLPAQSKDGRKETMVELKRPKTHENSTHVLAGESPVNRARPLLVSYADDEV